MALGSRKDARQEALFVVPSQLTVPGHPFYERVGRLLAEHDFDRFCEEQCAPHYAAVMGRPGLPPGNYFRLMMIGYFERLESDRQIAWRVADSLSLRAFLGLALDERTPDHSTLSGTRRRLPLAVHQAVFAKVLAILAQAGLLRGETLGVDATMVAANASLKQLRTRLDGQSYTAYVRELMAQDPAAPKDPTAEDVGRYDRRRRGKKLSNADWHNPHNPEARLGRMKDGRTRFCEKVEHAVDLTTGAVVGVTVQPGDTGDPQSVLATLAEAAHQLGEVKAELAAQQAEQPRAPGRPPARRLVAEVVADKGYHSDETCRVLQDLGCRTYLSEPARGRRRWRGKAAEQAAVLANRRRIRGERGKRLLRQRGELLERPFAHYLDGGGLRRMHLRGHENITKRLLVHVAGFNLGLALRQLCGAGTPRACAALLRALSAAFWRRLAPLAAFTALLLRPWRQPANELTPPNFRRDSLQAA